MAESSGHVDDTKQGVWKLMCYVYLQFILLGWVATIGIHGV